MKSSVTTEAAAALETRARRALLLSKTSSSAAELLRFVALLSRVQAGVVSSLEQLHATGPLCGRWSEDGRRVTPILLEVPSGLEAHAPEPLAHQSRSRAGEDPAIAQKRLGIFWSRPIGAGDDFLSRVMLEPWLVW